MRQIRPLTDNKVLTNYFNFKKLTDEEVAAFQESLAKNEPYDFKNTYEYKGDPEVEEDALALLCLVTTHLLKTQQDIISNLIDLRSKLKDSEPKALEIDAHLVLEITYTQLHRNVLKEASEHLELLGDTEVHED